jgi:integrase
MAVTVGTDKRYRERCADVVNFAARRRLALTDLDEWDVALDAYGLHLFEQGEAAAALRMAIYGVAHVLDAPGRSPLIFPLAKKSLRGFLNSSPENMREPPPEEAIWLIAYWLVGQAAVLGVDAVLCAAAVLLAFDAYLRPSETLGLTVKHVTRPSRGAPRYRDWALTIAPQGGGAPAKNHEFDCSVIVGLPPRTWAPTLLAKLVGTAGHDGRLFRSLTLPKYERLMRTATAACDLCALRVDPHSVRHVGPSIDSYEKRLSPPEVQARGRWRCVESCRRYSKPAALLRQVAKLSRQQLNEARRVASLVPRLVCAAL